MSNPYFNSETFIKIGNQMIHLVASKYKELEKNQHPVLPKVEPGFLRKKLPTSPPMKAESFEEIMNDTATTIFSSTTQWAHPKFFAYYPSNISHSAITAEIFANSFGTPGFLWIVNPVQTELENIVMDWLVQALQLPDHFYMKNTGGGTISNTISDAVFVIIQVAKRKKMRELNIEMNDPKILKFCAYYSKSAHSSTEKGRCQQTLFLGLFLNYVYYKKAIPTYFDEKVGNFQVDLDHLKKMIKEDIENGLIPFWYGATYGTTGTCAYEQISEIGKICEKYGIFLNVDAAYAGSSWLIPEYREKVKGLELADSILINFAKAMSCGISASLTFVKNKNDMIQGMGGQINIPIYENKFSDSGDVCDYKDWQVALGKKFNALKIWWVIRSFGIEGMRQNLSEKFELAQYFNSLIKQSNIFKEFTKQELGLSTFVLHHENLDKQNEMNQKLYKLINSDTTNGLISSSIENGIFYQRVVVCNHNTRQEHLDEFFGYIAILGEQVLKECV